MSHDWARIIKSRMEPVQLIVGEATTVYKVRGEDSMVWVLTEMEESPGRMTPLDRHEMAPIGGRELSFDVGDPHFLIVEKTMGVAVYTHIIPWDKIVDIVFRSVTT